LKKIIISVFILLMALSISMAATVGENILQNSDFTEKNSAGTFPEYWDVDSILSPSFGYADNPTNPLLGILSFSRIEADRVIPEEMYQGDVTNPIELVSGGIYEVGFDAELTDMCNDWGEYSITVKIECFDNANYASSSSACCAENYVKVLPGFIKTYIPAGIPFSTTSASPAQIRGKFQAPICNHKYARFYIYIDRGIYATDIVFQNAFLKYVGNKPVVASFTDYVFSDTYVRNEDEHFNVVATVDKDSNAFPVGTNFSNIMCSFTLYPTMRPSVKYITPTIPAFDKITIGDTIAPVDNGKYLSFNIQSKTDFIKDLERGAYTLKVTCHKSDDINIIYGEDILYLNIVDSSPSVGMSALSGYYYTPNTDIPHTGRYVFNINGNPTFLMGLIDRGNPDNSLSIKDVIGAYGLNDYLCRIDSPTSAIPFSYNALGSAGLNFILPENLYQIPTLDQILALNVSQSVASMAFLYPFQDFYSEKMNPSIYSVSEKESIIEGFTKALSGQSNIIGWYINSDINNINLEESIYNKKIISKIDNTRPFFNGFNLITRNNNVLGHSNEYNDISKAGELLVMDFKPNNEDYWTTNEIEGISSNFDILKMQEVFNLGTKFIISKIALRQKEVGLSSYAALSSLDLLKLIKQAQIAGADGILFDSTDMLINLDQSKNAITLNSFMMAIDDRVSGDLFRDGLSCDWLKFVKGTPPSVYPDSELNASEKIDSSDIIFASAENTGNELYVVYATDDPSAPSAYQLTFSGYDYNGLNSETVILPKESSTSTNYVLLHNYDEASGQSAKIVATPIP